MFSSSVFTDIRSSDVRSIKHSCMMEIVVFLIISRIHVQGMLCLQEEHSTYPDMAAYHSIAVTLGQAGHLTQLLDLIESLREGPVKKTVKGSPRQLNWNGRLEPDIVVYNAVRKHLL